MTKDELQYMIDWMHVINKMNAFSDYERMIQFQWK